MTNAMTNATHPAQQPPPEPSRRRLLLAGITALYLALSLLIFVNAAPEARLQPDSYGYISTAVQLGQGDPEAFAWRMPGYPLLLKPFLDAENRLDTVSVLALQTLLAILTALTAQRICSELTGRPGVAVYALTLLNPGSIIITQLVLTEVLFTFLLTLHILCMVRTLRGGRHGPLAGAALCAFLLYLVKPQGLAVYAVSLGVAACAALARHGWRKALRLGLLGACLFLLPLVGYLLAKHQTTGDWALAPTRYSRLIGSEWLTAIESKTTGFPLPNQNELRQKGREYARRSLGIPEDRWRAYSEEEQQGIVVDNLGALVRGYGAPTLARGLAMSVYSFFVDDPGGLVLFVGLPNVSLRDLGGPAGADASPAARAAAAALKVGVYLYTCAKMLLLALTAGLLLRAFRPGRNRPWGPPPAEHQLLALQVLLALAVCSFMAYARFRFPVDPLLHVLLVLYAFPVVARRLWPVRPARPAAGAGAAAPE